MGFGHIGLTILLMIVALIVFGPKRMIEMVSQLWKTLLNTRDALKEMSWNLSVDEPETPTPTAASTSSERDHLRVVESAPPLDEQ